MAFRDKDKERAYRKAWASANKERLRAYYAARYAANAESVKARVRAYAADNKDAIQARNAAARAAHPEKYRARSKAYYLAHREERIAYQAALHIAKAPAVKAYKKQWWASNREEFSKQRKSPEGRARQKAQFKKWYDETYYSKHREKFLARNARRRALKTTTEVGPIDFAQILKDANGVCGICHEPFDLFGIDFDHIVPLARGGAHIAENIQATHARCNRSKGARVG
jgi:5-methylcytosine-specific restriction endonuclease McrA